MWGAVRSSVRSGYRRPGRAGRLPKSRGGGLLPGLGGEGVLAIHGAKRSPRVEWPRVVASGASCAQTRDFVPFLGRPQFALSGAAPVSPRGFSLPVPPPACPPPAEHIFAYRSCGAAELFLPHCESRNELEASRACMLLLVQ